MSKPDKPGELRNVDVQAISIVSNAANRQKFKVFKNARDEPASETIEKNERGLFHILKEFFTGEKIEKGEVADIVSTQDKGQRLSRAMDALLTVLGLDRWGEISESVETSPTKIRAAINDFKNVAEEILLDKDEDIKKTVAELEKSGRKISGSRLTKLKDVQAMLNDVLNGLEENKEDTELINEEVTKAVIEALKPITERIEKLETPEAKPEQPDIAEIVKSAVAEAIAPLTVRVEKIENARGFSNRVPEDTQISKGNSDFWDGAF